MKSRRLYIKRFPEFITEQADVNSILATKPTDPVEKIVKEIIADEYELNSRLVHRHYDLMQLSKDAIEINGYMDSYFECMYDHQILVHNVFIEVESQLSIEVSDMDFDNIKTVGDLIEFCQARIYEKDTV